MEDIRAMERETKALLDAKVPELCWLNLPFFAAFNPAFPHFEQLSISSCYTDCGLVSTSSECKQLFLLIRQDSG